MNNYLSEAFKQLDVLDEDVFELDKDGIRELKDFEDASDDEEFITVVDPDADDEEDLEDSYIGKVILDCAICHTDSYKNRDEIIIDDETGLANIGEECPYCFSNEGYKIIGEVKPFVEVDVEAKDEDSDEEEVEVEVDESLQEDTEKQGEHWVNKGSEGTHGKFRTKKAADAQRKAMFANGYKAESLKESCNIDQCQKWVDYDMDKYHRISDDTMEKIKSSGYSVVKDQYGYYEVIADRKDESMTESIEDITIDTGDQEIVVSTRDKEEKIEDEMIVPVTDETKSEIEMDTDDSVDVDVDEFEEEDFDELGESYLKKVYENVESYKTTSVKSDNSKLYLEGLIKFNSGKEKKTSFVFEAKTITKNGKAKLIGENLQISKGHKSFKLAGTLNNGKFISESLNYNYRVKDGNESKRVYGTVKVSK